MSTTDPDAFLTDPSSSLLGKNALSLLHEYAQAQGQSLSFPVISQSGEDHQPTFAVAVLLDDRQFPAVLSSNKRDATMQAASQVLFHLSSEARQAQTWTTNDASATLFDRVASTVLSSYSKLCLSVRLGLIGCKVLAGFVLERTDRQEMIVISLATGNKCAGGSVLSSQGQVVHDSHAEQLARRGLLRYLYQQIDRHRKNLDSIFEKTENDLLSLKSTLRIHFYTSFAPCGDSALFSPKDEIVEAKIPSEHEWYRLARAQGQLRSKIENGEGTIPTEARSVILSLDAVKNGKHVRHMSCSDKVFGWNLLGIQGALLSHLVHPIYLHSITIGFPYHYGHLCRALCCRLQDYIHSNPPVPPYRLNHPIIGHTALRWNEEKSRARTTNPYDSLNWNLADQTIELIEPSTGKRKPNNEVSRLCKSELFQLFKGVYPTEKKTYYQLKQMAKSYQQCKQLMFRGFELYYFTGWISKDPCLSMFS